MCIVNCHVLSCTCGLSLSYGTDEILWSGSYAAGYDQPKLYADLTGDGIAELADLVHIRQRTMQQLNSRSKTLKPVSLVRD